MPNFDFFIFLFIVLSSSFIAYMLFDIIKYSSTNGKLMYKKLAIIHKVQSRNNSKCIDFLSKTEKFSICVVEQKGVPSISYITIPVYDYKEVFINDELVCRTHN